MSRPRCVRRWEAEVFHEGRLRNAEKASFERHVVTCDVCKNELAALGRLKEELRALPEPERLDEVTARRRRLQLLADVNRSDSEMPPKPRRALPYAALASVVVAAVVALVVLRGVGIGGSKDANGTAVHSIIASSGARWTRTESATVERVELGEGELTIKINHAEAARNLLIVVPDGEIEDVGTAFVVRVREGSTKQIVVSEGAVIFRRSGEAPIRIEAGGSWDVGVRAAARSAAASIEPPTAIGEPIEPTPSAEVRGASVPSTSLSPERVETAAGLLAQANEARRSGDEGRALLLHRRLQSTFSTSREAHASYGIMGRLLLDRADAAGALVSFDAYRARGHGPLDESVLVGRATALERLGRTDEAGGAWSELLRTFPNSPYAEHARLRSGTQSPDR